MKKRFFARAALFLLAVGVVCGSATATSEKSGITPDEGLKKLMEGNARYLKQEMTISASCDMRAREKLARGQNPFAIVLSCSDSRVPPEIIFDQGLGEIFVVRVAGNIPDPLVLGSIEYAVEHLGSSLIMVLAHENCGAVTATIDAKGKPEGNIGAIVKTIAPAAARAKQKCKGQEKSAVIECAVDENAKNVAANIPRMSKVIKSMISKGKLNIVTAKYDLDDGKVSLLK